MPVRRQDRSAEAVAFGFRLALLATALAGLYGVGWLSLAPNRLLPGRPIAALAVLGPVVHGVALAGVAAVVLSRIAPAARPGGVARWLPPGLVLAAAVLLLALTGAAAAHRLAGSSPLARVMLGSGLWTALAALAVLGLDLARGTGTRFAAPAAGLGLVVALGLLWRVGLFDALSLAVEYRARAGLLGMALVQHVELAGGALALALAGALPLGWAAFRSDRVEIAVGGLLGAVQVVPAIALFGLLVPLLAVLLHAAPDLRRFGLAAIGAAPALIGVAAYLALPLVRGIVAGLKAADPAAVEAARAMGFTEARLAREIRLPLGLPVFAGALRIAAVQSIGLTTLGGLIGAGGLGALVFEGMAQFAPDLIVLSAVPIVALALAVDGILGAASRRLGAEAR